MSGQSHRNPPGPSRRRQSGSGPNSPESNVFAPGRYSGPHYYYAAQGATGTTHPTAYGSRTPSSPRPQQGVPWGYDPSRPSQVYQQPPMGQSPRGPSYPVPSANEPHAYPLGPGGFDPAGIHSASRASYPYQTAIEPRSPHPGGFVRSQNPGPRTAIWCPSEGHAGVQSSSKGPHSAGRPGKKKALAIGTNYPTHPDPHFKLKCCTEDVYSIAHLLCTKLGFKPHDIRLMTDHAENPRNLPTKDNILAAMRALVADAQPGDSFFFYFSGHGTQIKDTNGDEVDGLDECICAMDYHGIDPYATGNTPGLIVDDDMHETMVKYLPRGCRLMAMFDSCHSGTALDLPYIYDSIGNVKPCMHPNRSWLLREKANDAEVVSLSASKDGERARETHLGGALRCAFIECVKASRNTLTYRDLLCSVREYMKRHRHSQRPQLSSSNGMDTDIPFLTMEELTNDHAMDGRHR